MPLLDLHVDSILLLDVDPDAVGMSQVSIHKQDGHTFLDMGHIHGVIIDRDEVGMS